MVRWIQSQGTSGKDWVGVEWIHIAYIRVKANTIMTALVNVFVHFMALLAMHQPAAGRSENVHVVKRLDMHRICYNGNIISPYEPHWLMAFPCTALWESSVVARSHRKLRPAAAAADSNFRSELDVIVL